MAVKERLKEYLDYKRISMRQFTIAIGVSPSYVSNINKSIQPDKIDSITNIYPDLNTGWLLTGEGEMLKSADKPIPTSNNASSDPMSILQFLMEEKKAASAQIEELIRQNGILSETIRSQNEIIKKAMGNQESDVHLGDSATCANVSGSDLED